MQRIYSHKNLGVVHHLKNVLENNGIKSEVRGEHLMGASGGVAPTDAWIELWLADENRISEAQNIIEESISDIDTESSKGEKPEPWVCPNCREEVDGAFAVCWNCQTQQPETTV